MRIKFANTVINVSHADIFFTSLFHDDKKYVGNSLLD